MNKLLGTVLLATATALLFPTPAAAAECGLLSAASGCSTAPLPPPNSAPAPTAEPTPAPAPAPAPAAAPEPAAAARILTLVNDERSAAGMRPLSSRPDVVSIAARHSATMADRGDIFHNAAYFTAATRTSLRARLLGENVAMNNSADDAHRRLMASPGHRANILNAAFDTVGIAVVRSGSGSLFVTQNFLASASAAAPAPAPLARPAARVARPVPAPRAARTAPTPAAAPAPEAATVAAPAAPVDVPVPATPTDAPRPGESHTPLAFGAASGLLAGMASVGRWLLRYGWPL